MRVTSLAFTQPSGVTTHRFEKRSCGLSPGLGSALLPVFDERRRGRRLHLERRVSERLADAFDCGRRLGRHP